MGNEAEPLDATILHARKMNFRARGALLEIVLRAGPAHETRSFLRCSNLWSHT